MTVEEAMPFNELWVKIAKEFSSGDGCPDKFCMELIGSPSSRCRPQTRDIRKTFRADSLAMMRAVGVPRLCGDRRIEATARCPLQQTRGTEEPSRNRRTL